MKKCVCDKDSDSYFPVIRDTNYSSEKRHFIRDLECEECHGFSKEYLVFFGLVEGDSVENIPKTKNKCLKCNAEVDMDNDSDYFDDGDDEIYCFLWCSNCQIRYTAKYVLDETVESDNPIIAFTEF